MSYDDVIKWKQFPRYWPFVRGIHRSPVNSPHKGQWREALLFSLIYAEYGWVNNREVIQDAIAPIMTSLQRFMWMRLQKTYIWLKLEITMFIFYQIRIPTWIMGDWSFQWRHSERNCVSNHWRIDCVLNRLFRRRSKKTPKLRISKQRLSGDVPNVKGSPLNTAKYCLSERRSNSRILNTWHSNQIWYVSSWIQHTSSLSILVNKFL